MTRIKDKLAASVREAKARGQAARQSASPAPAGAAAEAARSQPPARAPATVSGKRSTGGAVGGVAPIAGEPVPSAGELFPKRVWPD